jgi:hypothetical protein
LAVHSRVIYTHKINASCFADKAGYEMHDICAFEEIRGNTPAWNFLREWVLTGRATVQIFLDILTEVERPDVRDVILQELRDQGWRFNQHS